MGLDPERDVVYFGRTDFRNTNRLFGVKRKDRRQHMYVIGKTGTGKSAMLNNLIVQDIANGEGVCVVDPHGELVEGILEKIPEERLQDVIYFNPADPDFHIGFNVLEIPDQKYKHLVSSGLMGIFTKIWAGVWSPRMEYILNNCILALIDNPGSTLMGISRILVDKTYRQKIVQNVADPVVKAFWVNEYEQWQDKFRNEAIAPIQNKVGQFLSTAMVRNIVGQSKSTINIFDIMNTGKIFLVNVSKGRIGEDNAALLGAMLITQVQLSAMERVRIPEEERVDFYLYVDEFQNFATDSFAGILSEARKYRLNLILAHQYIGQLVTDVSTRVRDAVFGNVGTMIVFRVGATDAEFLEKEFEPEFLIQDIVNLPNYRIYLKLMVDGITARPFSAATLPPFKVKTSGGIAQEIIENSQKRYARPREIVEEEINNWSGVMSSEVRPEGAGDRGRPQERRWPARELARPQTAPASGTPPRQERQSERQFARPRPQEQYASELADLGIGFEKREVAAPSPRAPELKSGGKEPAPAMSLADLRPSERPARQKQSQPHADINIDELRHAISESLHKAAEKKDGPSTALGASDDENDEDKEHLRRT